MNATICSASSLRLLTAGSLFALVKVSNALRPAPNGDYNKPAPQAQTPDPLIAAIHGRAYAITPTLKGILEARPPSHWGLNE